MILVYIQILFFPLGQTWQYIIDLCSLSKIFSTALFQERAQSTSTLTDANTKLGEAQESSLSVDNSTICYYVLQSCWIWNFSKEKPTPNQKENKQTKTIERQFFTL